MISPAQGAMFAPLALKFVQGDHFDCFMFDNPLSFRAPISTIKANVTTTRAGSASEQPATSPHTGAIAGAVVGCVAAVLLVIGATVFVRRRRALSRRKYGGSKISTAFIINGSPATITPFNPSPLDTTQQAPLANSWVEQRRLVPEHPDEGMAPDPPDVSPTPSPALSRPPVALVPPGLYSKELARLRTGAQQIYVQHSSDTTQLSSTPALVTEQSGATLSSDTLRLQSEVESLRRDMQLRFEPPPSYTSRDV